MVKETKCTTKLSRTFSGPFGLLLSLSLVGFTYLFLSYNIGNPYIPAQARESSIILRSKLAKIVDSLTTQQPGEEEIDLKKPKSSLRCNFTDERSDVCEVEGDVRIHTSSSSVMLVGAQKNNDDLPLNETKVVRPYTRKQWSHLMIWTKEIAVRPLYDSTQAPSCTVNHRIPAVIFSLGGYNMRNYYHMFSDILVPLFMTSHQFNGEVQFLITSILPWWVDKFREIFRELSHYDVIDFDKEGQVHCYPKVIVGLYSQGPKELSFDPSRVPNGYSVHDYTKLLRTAYSLCRNSITNFKEEPEKKPRLLIISRNNTRKIMNLDEIVPMATELGYEVVVEDSSLYTVSDFAQIVNSCDVTVGVHGAGLTNLCFLPINSVIIEIVPFGGIEGISWSCFGIAALDLNLGYFQYIINEEESSLIEKYSRDDPVLRDPASIHKKGWPEMAKVYLFSQDVKLNITRFRATLVQAFDYLRYHLGQP